VKILLIAILVMQLAGCATIGGTSPTQSALMEPINPVAKLVAPAKKIDTAPQENLLTIKPTDGKLSSVYGMRKLRGRTPRFHKGIDIQSNRGTPVLASGNGIVLFAGKKGSYGKLVEIQHDDGLVTRYAHLDTIVVKKGQKVQPALKIGTVGKTGRAAGYNLHFEVLVENKPVDPLDIVKWA
jgi:murein DD-endopeptidase MepM/ murein hydrolase activator NlpD